MSQIKIIVRQPPNRDFLEGFPGIPPNAPERPHAALRGTVELRVQGGTPVKAKWVQIELKKIETLLQGQGEPYVETIGHAPKIWTANGEYENLQVRDFPFYIQIPMNVPPSIALEKGSGIRYEMVASLCVKGKKGLLRKDKNNVTSTSVPIVMDKHELHTLWPVYHRPQTSTATNDGLNLIVTRDASCYGPGDSVTARVELRSGRTSPCILRAWEMTLREHVIFRPDPSQVHNSKQAPVANGQQYRHNVIAEQKKSLSKTIYEGVTVEDDLACLIPIQHRTATTQGRLIEVQFTLSVKAVMESAGSVEVMMPVLMSHWSKEMSENSLRKIGPVPHLGINFPPAQPAKQQPQGYSQMPSNGQLNAPYNSPPLESPPIRPQIPKAEMPHDEVGPPSPPYTPPETGMNFSTQQVVARPNGRPRESTITGRNRQLAVVNIGPTEDGRPAAQSTSTAPPPQTYKASWETAEEEKKRLKESYTQDQAQSSGSVQAANSMAAPASPPVKPNFSSAEDEKERLYKRAQAQARKTQDLARREQGLPPRTPMTAATVSRETSTSASASASDSSAMRPATANTVTSVASSAVPVTPPTTAAGKASSPRSDSTTPGAPGSPNWASAEAEKERLYRAAQRRARETQARVASASGSMTGRSRSGSNTSLTSMTTQRQSTIQGARPASTFKLNNPDPPEDKTSVAAPVKPVSPAPAPVPAPSVSPAPAPAAMSAPGGSSAASAAQQMYAQAMASRQSQPAPAPGFSARQSVAYAPAPAASTYGHAARPSQASPAGYSQGSGSQGASSQPPGYAPGSSSGSPPAGRNWSSAEDEKSQLNLYYEAKRAVANRAEGSLDDTMAGGSSSAYGRGQSGSPSPPSTHAASPSASQRIAASPPPANSYGSAAPMRVNSIASHRQEQTPSPVYMRTYPQHAPTPPVTHTSPPADYFNQQNQRSQSPRYASPPPPSFTPAVRASQAPVPADEKERMKLFFEAQDAARRYQDTAGAGGSGSSSVGAMPPPPAASASSYSSPPAHAGPPGYDDAPPAFDGGSSRPMSALEEKARLAREYQQQQQVAQGPLSRTSSIQSVRSPGPSQMPQYGMSPMQSPSYGNNGLPPLTTQYAAPPMSRSNSAFKYIPSPIEEEPPVGPPPPLMPRPPQEYIEQIIQEEDEEVPPAPAIAPETHARLAPLRQGSWDPQPLNFRPVSPFSIPLPSNAQSPPLPQNQHWQQPPPAQPQYVQQYQQQPQAPYYR